MPVKNRKEACQCPVRRRANSQQGGGLMLSNGAGQCPVRSGQMPSKEAGRCPVTPLRFEYTGKRGVWGSGFRV